MKEHAVNKLNNFIGGWYMDDLSVCDKLIEVFKNSPDKILGRIGAGVDQNIKKSTDCPLSPNDFLNTGYNIALRGAMDAYINKYPKANEYAPFDIIEAINLQHYAPSEGYYGWHTERASTQYPSVTRHLVFLTYLNDVTEGGETEFMYQNIKVKPEKGLTLIWGADWTFTHRGCTSFTQDKYIATGWYNYV
jgi:hypothetical protein